MQFYDLFRELIGYIPERFGAISSVFYSVMPFVLMACALFTAFFGLKCAGWWCALTFFFLGATVSSKYILPAVNIYDFWFWIMFGACLIIGVLCAYFSKYLFRAQLAASEFLIVYAALPSFILYFGDIPSKIISAVVALAIVFLTVKYKYIFVIPTTAFSGSFIFWEAAQGYVDFGQKTVNAIIMGIVATAFQCYISRDKLKETYKDVKKKYNKTKDEGERVMYYVKDYKSCCPENAPIKNIELKSHANIRDLGGIKVEGGVIKPHMLIRGAHLSGIDDADIDKLILEYNLKTVIDLRTETEKQEQPDFVLPNFNYIEIPVFDDSVPGMTHESKQNLEKVPDMRRLYEYVMNSDCVYNFGTVVRQIVRAKDEEFAFLYHCTEGKDRTGMVTAILLLLLGADREDIVNDYLYTNIFNKNKALKYYMLVRVFKHNKVAADRVYNVFMAREEYINEVFKAVDKMGLDSFAINVLKLTRADIENFRNRVVDRR